VHGLLILEPEHGGERSEGSDKGGGWKNERCRRRKKWERKWSTAGGRRLWEWEERQTERRDTERERREGGSKKMEREREREHLPAKLHPSLPVLLQ